MEWLGRGYRRGGYRRRGGGLENAVGEGLRRGRGAGEGGWRGQCGKGRVEARGGEGLG